MFEEFIKFVQELYRTNGPIPLHEPVLGKQEKDFLDKTIDTTFVSSIGECVEDFERKISEFTGIRFAVATVNGTSALHTALHLNNVLPDTEVITQSFSFVAISNSIRYCKGHPVFIDVDKETLGLSPSKMEEFLHRDCEIREDGTCWNKVSNRRVIACVLMHTFGFPSDAEEIKKICEKYNLILVEDAAESLGSFYKGQHTGKIGEVAILSFNGNKIITTGGGGMILTDNEELAFKAKHITSTAKVAHKWEFTHDEIGFNYRMPNLNAALGLAQMESLNSFLDNKRQIAKLYQDWGDNNNMIFFKENPNSQSNYWLNTVITKDRKQRDVLLEETNNKEILTRPSWTPMHKLKINEDCQAKDMSNTNWLHERIVNVPSSVIIK